MVFYLAKKKPNSHFWNPTNQPPQKKTFEYQTFPIRVKLKPLSSHRYIVWTDSNLLRWIVGGWIGGRIYQAIYHF